MDDSDFIYGGRIACGIVFIISFITALATAFTLASTNSNPALFGGSIVACIISGVLFFALKGE